ncbi:MAG: choice-of-anchor I family protein [Phycisphaera sp.]|nr:MAG: choice-of-anchor I family protein [Phycisphaera sp.]
MLTRLLAVAGLAVATVAAPTVAQSVELEFVGRYESGAFDEGAAEIVAFDTRSGLAFVSNALANTVDALDISDPNSPTLAFTIDLAPYGAGVNSVAVSNGLVAVAVEADPKQDPGHVAFFDTDGTFKAAVEVGALPDMVTFTPNGRYALVANEGEPNDDYTVDPEGSVSVIRIRPGREIRQSDVRTAGFGRIRDRHLDDSVRIFGPGASIAQDLEPEYIAVDPNGRTAYVVCQENNAIVTIDVRSARVTDIWGLGTKNHAMAANAMDASNRDDAINIATWPVHGYYLPDTIATYTAGRRTFIVTANEGDARDYDGFSEEARVGDLDLDPDVFPDATTLQLDENLGRLKITTTAGDTDGDGDFDRLFSYGGRGFSIFDTTGRQVFDSADDLERITAMLIPDNFNSTNDENDSFDNRSDDKGPEPEALALGTISGNTYAFVGAERVGGIFVYDITDPRSPVFESYTNSRDFSGDPELGTAGDLAPEGIVFVSAADSPTGEALLLVAHEVSGTMAVYRVTGGGCSVFGDVTGDCVVDAHDLIAVIHALGRCDGCPEDLNGDGRVDIIDVLLVFRAIRDR